MTPTALIARRYANPRNSKRFLSFVSAIALASVALGSMALIISLAVLDGFERELRENSVKFTSHIQVQAFGQQPLPHYQQAMRTLPNSVPGIASVSAFVAQEGIIRSPQYLDGVMVKGIQPSADISALISNVVHGTFNFSAPDAYEMVIGQALARKLGIDTGGSVVIYSITGEPSLANPPVVEQFRVVGTYATGMTAYDDLYVYIPFATAAELFSLPPDAASGFDVMVKDITRIESIAEQMQTVLGYPYYPRTVYEMYGSMFAWIELQKKPIPVILGLISIVAVFNIVATLLMLVVEKMHAVGVLRSLGMKRSGILRIFLSQGILLGAVGTSSGCLLGFAVCWLQSTYKIISLKGEIYFLDAVPIEFSVWHYALVVSVSMFFCVLATLIPSLIASRIQPLRALRFR